MSAKVTGCHEPKNYQEVCYALVMHFTSIRRRSVWEIQILQVNLKLVARTEIEPVFQVWSC